MAGLRNILENAQRQRVAVGHFNIGDFTILKGVFASAKALKVPVIVGVSEGEREFLGTHMIAAMVESLRQEFDVPIYLNADHTHSLASAMQAAKAGFDSVVFDLSALPIDENIQQTRSAVQQLKAVNPSLLIEGEIGDIGTGSEIHDQAPDLAAGLSDPEEAKRFVDATGIDVLAPAVGNMHGMLQGMVQGHEKKRLDLARIANIKRRTGALLTLHGGSGTEDDDLEQAIAAGITIIHINTEIRLAWRRGLERSLSEHPNEIVPYKVLPAAIEAIEEVVTSRLKLFNHLP